MSSLLFFFFFFNDTATTEIYTLSLHDALPICARRSAIRGVIVRGRGRMVAAGDGGRHALGHFAHAIGTPVDRDAVAGGVRGGPRVGGLVGGEGRDHGTDPPGRPGGPHPADPAE